MNTSTTDMLSPELDWRQADIRTDRLFPQYNDNILVVIEAGTPDEASDAALRLYQSLFAESSLFKTVYYPPILDIFRKSSLLFLDIDELQDLSDNLATIQPFLSRLADDQSLHGLFNMLGDVYEEKQKGKEIDISPLLEQMNPAFQALDTGTRYRMSWRVLMTGENDRKDQYREFIILQPRLDYGGLFPARTAIETIRQYGQDLGLTEENGIKLRLTGSVSLSYKEMQSVFKGMGFTILSALLLVTVLLVLGLQSVWLVLACLVNLVCGLLITAAFATFTVGELNLISVAFAVLYIGLGIDFSIHFCLKYRELVTHENITRKALVNTATHTGISLLLCALTTALGFYAFIPTDYDGVAELGLISGTGMLISLVITMTLLPALLACVPGKFSKPVNNRKILNKILEFPFRYSQVIRITTVILFVISVFTVTRVQFDHNTLNLQSMDNESVQTFIDLLGDNDASPWSGIALSTGDMETEQLVNRLEDLDLVDSVVWIRDFIPDDQDEKLSIIEEMDLLLGGMATGNPTSSTNVDNLESMNNLAQILEEFIHTDTGLPDDLDNSLYRGIHTILDIINGTEREQVMNRLETMLLTNLPGRLNELTDSLAAGTISMETLPPALKNRWLNDGTYRLSIKPSENMMDNMAMRRFVESATSIVPDMTGAPVINIRAGDAVIIAFKQAFIYAFISITILLLVLLRWKSDIFYILTPLVLAILFSGAISVFLAIPLNFANIIALPLLLGIGIDSAIHIVHRIHNSTDYDETILATSSARAVVLSALTTIVSIGNLAFSRHTGTASMGLLLTIGISMTLVCTLVVLPALLKNRIRVNHG